MHRFSKFLAVLALALAPVVAHAAGEQFGRIQGTIIDAASGVPVPGADVTISGPALIGGPKKLTTGDDGRYEAVGLPAGRYDVEVSYAGVKPIKRRVVVRQGETTPLDIQWSAELAQAEVTVVVEERHMTKPDSTQSGTVITSESEGKVAMSDRRYQFFANQIAGVTGENNGLFQNVRGSTLDQNRYLIDGVDITDPVTGTFSANLNLDLVSSEEILTGGMEAQYNSLGGVFNVITSAGSDEFHVDGSIYINNASFAAPNKYSSQVLGGYRQFFPNDSPPSQSYQANINVGGPILKHRLWFNVSAEYFYEEFSQPVGPPINIQHPSFFRHQFLGHLKLTWAPNEQHRVTIAAHTDPAFLNNMSTRFAGLANYELGVAEDHQDQGGAFVSVQWDYFKNQNLNAQIQGGYQWQILDFGPQGILGSVDFGDTSQYSQYGYSEKNRTYEAERPQHTNLVDNTVWYNGSDFVRDRRHQVMLDPSVSIRGNGAGFHDAKIGLQTKFAYHTQDFHRPGGKTYLDNNGSPLEAGLCDDSPTSSGVGCFLRSDAPDFHNANWGLQIGGYLQDRWKPIKRLTILPGIRIDWGITKNTIGETVSNMVGFGPRLGFTFDVMGDQKTILSAFYGRSNSVMDLGAISIADVSALVTTNIWNDTTKRFDPLFTSGGSNGYRIDPNASTPHSDEVTLSARRELFANSIATIDYTYKHQGNIWNAVEVNQIWDAAGTHVIGYVNGQPTQIFKATTPDSNTRQYHGVDFIFEARPTQNWDLYAAYTVSWTYGVGSVRNSPYYNPRQFLYYDGYLPEDHRHNLKLRASYSWSGLTVGALFNYLSGAPISKAFFNQTDGSFDNLRAPQGNDPGNGSDLLATANDPKRWAELRLPDQISVDLRLGYDFHALIKQHIALMIDFFNLFNLNGVTGVDTTNSSTYATVTGRQRPFRFEIGLRYTY